MEQNTCGFGTSAVATPPPSALEADLATLRRVAAETLHELQRKCRAEDAAFDGACERYEALVNAGASQERLDAQLRLVTTHGLQATVLAAQVQKARRDELRLYRMPVQPVIVE